MPMVLWLWRPLAMVGHNLRLNGTVYIQLYSSKAASVFNKLSSVQLTSRSKQPSSTFFIFLFYSPFKNVLGVKLLDFLATANLHYGRPSLWRVITNRDQLG